MRAAAACLLASSLVSFAACDQDGEPQGSSLTSVELAITTVGFTATLDPEPSMGETLAAKSVYVGRMAQTGSCPAPPYGYPGYGEWLVSPGHPDPLKTPKSSSMHRRCVYTWSSPLGIVPLTGWLPSHQGQSAMTWLDPDLVVVSPQSTVLEDYWAHMHGRFLDSIGHVAVTANAQSYIDRTLVYVLDTEQDANNSTIKGPVSHGLAMSNLIDNLLNPEGGASLGEVRQKQAMPVDGRGSFVDLARAIDAAVDEWLDQLGHSWSYDRLVLNLSLGIDPAWEADSSEGFAMVRDSLQRASCFGAAVIVSAGNRSGPDSDGPLFPASEEGVELSNSTCSSLFGSAWTSPPHVQLGSGAYRPVVFSVSGVGGNDQRLDLARSGSETRIVAPAALAVARIEANGGDFGTPPKTGSSVAAAVVSAAAAAAWAFDETLTARQLMQLVYASGVDLGRTAEHHFGGAVGVRRVDFCKAIDAACTGPSSVCQSLSCSSVGAYAGSILKVPYAAELEIEALYSAAERSEVEDEPIYAIAEDGVCDATKVLSPGDPLAQAGTLCADEQHYGSRSLPVGPQPPEPTCGDCFVDPHFSDFDVFLSIDEAAGATYADPSVALTMSDHSRFVYYLSRWVPDLRQGDRHAVLEVDLPSGYTGSQVRQATVSFRMDPDDGGRSLSTTTQLMVR